MTLSFGNLFGQKEDEGRRRKEEIYAISPAGFNAQYTDINDCNITATSCRPTAGIMGFRAGVHLPEKATILKIVLYSNDSTLTYSLWKANNQSTSGFELAASVVCNTIHDVDIRYSDIDNGNFSYGIYINSSQSPDIIYGGVITYVI